MDKVGKPDCVDTALLLLEKSAANPIFSKDLHSRAIAARMCLNLRG